MLNWCFNMLSNNASGHTIAGSWRNAMGRQNKARRCQRFNTLLKLGRQNQTPGNNPCTWCLLYAHKTTVKVMSFQPTRWCYYNNPLHFWMHSICPGLSIRTTLYDPKEEILYSILPHQSDLSSIYTDKYIFLNYVHFYIYLSYLIIIITIYSHISATQRINYFTII